jgi:hypothetical protein
LLSIATLAAKPGRLDITINQGGTFGPLVLTLKDASGAAVDLTGWKAEAQYRASSSSATVLATFTCTITDPKGGVIRVSLSDDATAALSAPAAGEWDLFVTTAAGEKYRILAGTVQVLPRVTR